MTNTHPAASSSPIDIVIKSFNRPYYLERCLRSIYQYIEGPFRIKILDDGTPSRYLEKIASLFPDAEILRSPLYHQKTTAIEEHINGRKRYNEHTIPNEFWIEQISRCSDVFLLLEDDIWLTGPVDTVAVLTLMQKVRIVMVKLSWLGNAKTSAGKKRAIGDSVEVVEPRISLLSKWILLNKFKLGSLHYRLGLRKFEFLLPFYNYYTVAAAFFAKEYWLYLWSGSSTTVNEERQLQQATRWALKNRSRFAKTVAERTKTSFITSATNTFSNVDLDIFHFNFWLNEAWLAGEFDAMDSFPNDIREAYIAQFLERSNDAKATAPEWKKWVERFKDQYRKIGCAVD